MAWMRDPVWTFVGVALTLASLIAGYVISTLRSTRKALAYEMVYQDCLLEGNRNVRDSFQVLYEGKEVQDPSLVVIAIYNSGNTPRLLSDYDQPVRVDFGQATEILSADVYAMEPSTARPKS